MMAPNVSGPQKINLGGLHPTPEKIRAIQEAPKPQSVTELNPFLGF